jgi:hypothetical protein
MREASASNESQPQLNPMILTRSKYHAIGFGLIACLLGYIAIETGDHHVELLFKMLVVVGVVLVLAGLGLLRYSWAIREHR